MSEISKVKNPSDVATVERTEQVLTFTPRFDIWENDDELILYGDLPGVSAENLEIRFEEKQLSIHGRVDARQGGVQYLYAEYGVGDFFRTFAIGEAMDASKIAAELKNGVLTVHLPKSEAVKPKRIEVRQA
ncbi:MAG: Hsp20/alpha crystallin family protein [Planctomycetaceae bacterium]|nr:MAG: Hsp20/alpha crystallin family protein [Planctomycetaceae bacterium]